MRDPLSTLLCLVLLGCSASFAPADEAAIRNVLAAQATAWNQGDIEAFMAVGYVRTDDLVFTSGGKIRRGYARTLAKYRARYGGGGKMGRLAFTILEVRGTGPDSAVVLGRWRLTETPEAGAGVFTLVLVRTAQGWRILHDHTSAAPKDKK